jgi:hypothetical protein
LGGGGTRKRPLDSEDSIKMNLRVVAREDVNWTYLT